MENEQSLETRIATLETRLEGLAQLVLQHQALIRALGTAVENHQRAFEVLTSPQAAPPAGAGNN